VLPDFSHSYQRAVQTRHCRVHLLHVVVVPVVFSPVVHLTTEEGGDVDEYADEEDRYDVPGKA